ncbi:MAG: GTPase HflX [Phycisphaeraceae bacterium]
MTQFSREQLSVQLERAILAACILPDYHGDPNDPLAELRSLADTAGAIPVDELLQKRQKPDSGTFLGSGKVDELRDMAKFHQADVIIFDNDLSPSQIGNIEKITEKKVLDRSELILDIFAARAQTYEAKLQVELAQLEYTYPRLRAMWSHLERIAGGAPAGIGTRGPGEQQLEIDRRIVQRKKSELKREIARIQGRKTRQVEARNVDFFTVGLVGYTNAGKSTLFNTLTGGDVYADDKLFATLSTRTKLWSLGGGDDVMLSDTVGFVRDLPHHLVASFRATLEEAVHSNLLLVVLDVSHPRAVRQLETVMQVLDDIGADTQPRVLALNKLDAVEHQADLVAFENQYPDALPISAKTGRGLDKLVERVRAASRGQVQEMEIRLSVADGKAINFIENRANVLDRQYDQDTVTMRVRIGQRQLDQLRSMGTTAQLPGDSQATRGWGR